MIDLQLSRLREMHPLLDQRTAWEYEHRAAIGLARHNHAPGVRLAIFLGRRRQNGALHWLEATDGDGTQLDFHRVTEDAAEAIALALVHAGVGWIVRRRLQRREFGDWLLLDADRNPVALEVSGVDTTDVAQRRLREKTEQISRCAVADRKAACVVELGPPRSRLRMA